MVARIFVALMLVCAVSVTARPPRGLAAQEADSAMTHACGGQPFHLYDGIWREGWQVLLPRGGTPVPAESASSARAGWSRLKVVSSAGAKSRRTKAGGVVFSLRLLVPVVGVARDQLRDSFGSARRGHAHRGIDILAPKGTPVVAVVDGFVLKMRWDDGGGRTLRLVDRGRKYVLYYAHLSRYARGLHEGQTVRRGQVVAYVGRTGSVHGSSHLHFGIASLRGSADKWWRARPLNPYPLLRRALGLRCRSATGQNRCADTASAAARASS